jgi:hypothetical protein
MTNGLGSQPVKYSIPPLCATGNVNHKAIIDC